MDQSCVVIPFHPSQGYKNEVLVGMQGEGILFTVGGNVINVATLGLNQEAP